MPEVEFRAKHGRPSSRQRALTPEGSVLDRYKKRMYAPFVVPALIIYAAIMLLPTLVSLWLSFYSWNGLGKREWRGLRNYEVLVQDPAFQVSFLNTIIILVGVGAVVFAVSFVMVAFMRDMRGKSFARSVVFVPFIISPIALSILWGVVFQHDGITNSVLSAIGITGPNWLGGSNAIYIVFVGLAWINIGLYVTIILAGADRVPRDFYDEARLAGASTFQRFRHITLPLSWDVISVAVILWTINSLKMFEFIFAFGGSSGFLPPVKLWNSAVFIYGQTFGGQVPALRFGYASASAVVTLAVFGILVAVLQRAMRRESVRF